MKAAPSSRWLCRIVRTLDGGERSPGNGFAARHLARCAECRSYFAQADALDTALRREAAAGRLESPDRMEERIMRPVRELADRRRPRRTFRPATFVLAGAAAGFAVVFALLSVSRTPPPLSAATPGTPPLAAVDTSNPPATPVTAPSLAALTAPVASALARDPLKNEAESVYADARSAVQFLALNFLPSGTFAQNGTNRPGNGG